MTITRGPSREGGQRNVNPDVQVSAATNLTTNSHVLAWLAEIAQRCQPDAIEWCDGSETERRRLTDRAVEQGVLIPLNQKKRPGCYLHRSDPGDVARVEHLTFICTPTKEEAGPTNHWMAPAEAYAKVGTLLEGSMRGRTMYVVPYLMGPLGSPFSKIGIEVTDSVYVVLSMRVMTRSRCRSMRSTKGSRCGRMPAMMLAGASFDPNGTVPSRPR